MSAIDAPRPQSQINRRNGHRCRCARPGNGSWSWQYLPPGCEDGRFASSLTHAPSIIRQPPSCWAWIRRHASQSASLRAITWAWSSSLRRV